MSKCKESIGQALLVDVKVGNTPIGKMRRRKSEVEEVLEILILRLKVLRGQEHTLGPHNTMQTLHGNARSQRLSHGYDYPFG